MPVVAHDMRNERNGLYLWRAVQAAVSTYPSIRSAMATLAQQSNSMDVARAGYYPSVKAGVSGGRQGNVGNGRVFSVNASQMLYDFGKVGSEVSHAKAGVQRQYAQVLMVVDDVARQTAQAVIEVRRFQLQEIAARKQIDALADLLKVAQARVSLGASNQADPVQAGSRLDAAESTLLSIRTQLQQWRSKLRKLVHEPLPTSISVLPEPELRQAVEVIQPDFNQVPQMQVAQLELEMARAQLGKAKAQQLPTISVSAGVDQNMGDMRNTQSDHDYNLMLNFTNSLFEGGALRAQERAAGHAINSAQEHVEDVSLDLKDKWQSLSEQITGLQSRLPMLTARKQSITETRRLYREQYLSLGTRSLLDLLNAEQEIFQAEVEHQNAIHDLLQARLDYVLATGQMRDVFNLTGLSLSGIEK
ncbi:TolC family protein [Ectopseudomonas mendocina]|uniref:TolC family protein n=1 Tax=Ectopseudomonas mendocina TaxID=300 RepID=A0ABZ2RDP2_ECTME